MKCIECHSEVEPHETYIEYVWSGNVAHIECCLVTTIEGLQEYVELGQIVIRNHPQVAVE